jgi:hypothetical protein
MSAQEFSFRAQFSRLNQSEDKSAYQYYMLPLLNQAQEAVQVLRRYGTLEARTWRINPSMPDANKEDVFNSYELYALSRVSDMLLLPYQPNRQNEDWTGPPVTLDERTEWFQSLGMILYNVDGRYDLNSANVLPDSDMQRILDEQGLTITEMIELVRHRCFILTDKDDSQGGLWPDPFRYREPKGKQ